MITILTPFEERIFVDGCEWLTSHTGIDGVRFVRAFEDYTKDFTPEFLKDFNRGFARLGFWESDNNTQAAGYRLCWTFEDDEKDWAMLFKLIWG
jgi:hypothetical protein